jgi:hypothetical protein
VNTESRSGIADSREVELLDAGEASQAAAPVAVAQGRRPFLAHAVVPGARASVGARPPSLHGTGTSHASAYIQYARYLNPSHDAGISQCMRLFCEVFVGRQDCSSQLSGLAWAQGKQGEGGSGSDSERLGVPNIEGDEGGRQPLAHRDAAPRAKAVVSAHSPGRVDQQIASPRGCAVFKLERACSLRSRCMRGSV